AKAFGEENSGGDVPPKVAVDRGIGGDGQRGLELLKLRGERGQLASESGEHFARTRESSRVITVRVVCADDERDDRFLMRNEVHRSGYPNASCARGLCGSRDSGGTEMMVSVN